MHASTKYGRLREGICVCACVQLLNNLRTPNDRSHRPTGSSITSSGSSSSSMSNAIELIIQTNALFALRAMCDFAVTGTASSRSSAESPAVPPPRSRRCLPNGAPSNTRPSSHNCSQRTLINAQTYRANGRITHATKQTLSLDSSLKCFIAPPKLV